MLTELSWLNVGNSNDNQILLTEVNPINISWWILFRLNSAHILSENQTELIAAIWCFSQIATLVEVVGNTQDAKVQLREGSPLSSATVCEYFDK